MKLRSSTKILIGFLVLAGVGYGGTYIVPKILLKNVDLHPIESSDLCLVAVSPKAGVKIITANLMVQVVEASEKFAAGESDGGGAQSGSVKKRIPVRELIGVLGGDPDSAQAFVSKMRETSDENETSNDAPLWTKDDIEKAISGDAALKTKLEHDLNVAMDGKPLPVLDHVAYFYGIRVKIPITVHAPNAKGSEIQTFDVVSFKPRLITRFYKSMESRFYDKSQLQSFYAAFIKEPNQSYQSMPETLRSLFTHSERSEELQKVERISSNSTILVNQSMIEKVSMSEENDGKVTTYDLKLKLSPEGKNRLWKFSTEGGTQILVVSKGVAIAAATIGTQLNSEELAIKQIPDRRLVEEAVSLVHPKT